MTTLSSRGAPRVAGLLDVARRAGVSPSTASRAIRGGSVSADRRERVLRAASELGYVPMPAAVRLSSGRGRTVGIVVPTASRWFFVEVVASAARTLRAAGYDLLLFEVGDTGHDQIPVPAELRGKVDAVLLVAAADSEAGMATFRDLAMPAVVVGGPRHAAWRVGIDDEAGAATAARHLVLLGHRDIAMISGQPCSGFCPVSGEARREGFRRVLEEAGVPAGPARFVSRPWGVAGGAAAMEQILGGNHLPTAIFAESDEMAFGAIQVLRRSGLDVPRDLSVVGFDDHEMAEAFDLTTVAQPVAEQGRAAATLLLDVLARGPDTARGNEVVLPTRLVVRGSACPPRSARR